MVQNNRTDDKRVVVGLSGGVDSAVAAALLQEHGYDVHAVTLKLWRVTQEGSADAELAEKTAHQLGIALTVIDLRERFYNSVVTPFANAYAEGLTPNPCVFCNPTLKFQALLEQADVTGARWIATGHYARIDHTASGSMLRRGLADHKDQSYALYRLTQHQLRRLLLPLGQFTHKDDVRAFARNRGIASAKAQDSQDLCFMAGGDYRSLIGELDTQSPEPGAIVDVHGKILGTHKGLAWYTVGQRNGLGIAAPERLYVIRLDMEHNQLVVGPREALARTSCMLDDVSFTHSAPASPFAVSGRIRYRAPLVPLTVTLSGDARAAVQFDEAQYAIAPGQSLVFYQDDLVLGGGVISKQHTT